MGKGQPALGRRVPLAFRGGRAADVGPPPSGTLCLRCGSLRAHPWRRWPPSILVPVSLARLEMGHLAATALSSVLRTLRARVPPGTPIMVLSLVLLLGRPLALRVFPSLRSVLLFIATTAAARGAAAWVGLARARSALHQSAVASAARRYMLATQTASPMTQPRTTRAARSSGGAAGRGAVVDAPRPSRCLVARRPSCRSSARRRVAPYHLGMGPPPPTAPRTVAVARPYHVLRRGVAATAAMGDGPAPPPTAEDGHPRESPARSDASTALAVVRMPGRPAAAVGTALGRREARGSGWRSGLQA